MDGNTVVVVTPAPTMIGHWFSGAASLADTSGFRSAGTHDGIAVGGTPGNLAYTTDVPPGFAGQALDLSAGSVMVSINNSATGDAGYFDTFDTLVRSNMTIAFWAKGLPGTWEPWVSKRGEDDLGYQVRRHGNGGASHACFTIRGTPGPDDPEGNLDISNTGAWYHYAAVWNGTSGTRQLFINGVLDTSINLGGDYAPLATTAGDHLVIGGRDKGGNFEAQFPGFLYDVRVYDNALSAAGVAKLIVPPVAQPVLTIQPAAGNQVRISWPVASTGFTLQQTSTLPGGWVNSGLTITVENSENVALAPATGASQYFRLIQ